MSISTRGLQLSLVGASGGSALDRAQEGNLRGDGRDGFFLLSLTRLVLRLEILQQRVKIFASLLNLGFETLNFRGDLVGGQRLLFLNQLGLFRVAEVQVVGAARRAEVLRRERLERLKVTAALVRVTSRRRRTGEVLQGWVTLNAKLLAKALLLGAIDVADDHVFVIRERLAELLPRRRERLAVTAPKNSFKTRILSSVHASRASRTRINPRETPSHSQIKMRQFFDKIRSNRIRIASYSVHHPTRPTRTRIDAKRLKNAKRNENSSKIARAHAPRGVKLDERALARVEHLPIERVDGEIHGEGVRTAREGERGDGAEGHLSGEHVRSFV